MTVKPVRAGKMAIQLQVIDLRLERACDVLSCLDYCRDAELNLGALAIATRDLIDAVRLDIRKAVRS